MSRRQTRAFVLGLADYRETSKLLRLLSEDYGRVSLVARGLASPKRKSALPEPFALVQVACSMREGADLGTLTSLEVERVFAAARSSVEGYALVSYWFEVVGAMAMPEQPGTPLFVLSESFMNTLDASSVCSAPVWWHFGRLLAAAGIEVPLHRCGRCDSAAGATHVLVAEGCALCPRCVSGVEDALPLQGLSPGPLGPALTGDQMPPRLMSVPLRAAESFVAFFDAMSTYHLGISARSYGFLCATLFARHGRRLVR